jgi:hypothetical protein
MRGLALDTYPYELLDGRHFQQLAQSLLVHEYRDIQCMPIAGPDGGRDAIQMRRADGENEEARLRDAVIFQVKFREPQALGTPTTDDFFDWLADSVTSELPKIAALKEHGARQYVVITNVPATGHLDSGLRDRMQNFLANNVDLPARCWWREDLDARLASRFDLVVHFGLFKGPESLRVILEGILSQRDAATTDSVIGRSSRDPAVTALLSYLDAQYREDARLRFKQADLPASPLLDFFVDVPVEVMVKEPGPALRALFDEVAISRAGDRTLEVTKDSDGGQSGTDETADYDIDDPNDVFESGYVPYYSPGGADLLLADKAASAMGRVVVEGAPGQGKSTLGQYICQVHRIRLLHKQSDVDLLPTSHVKAPVRLPFRIELRHLATYLGGRSPWERAGDSSTTPPRDWAASLESYIAAAVRSASGGLTCTQDDIVAILSRTPSLIVLDGLDEVPDIDDRIHLVSVVQESLSRLSALGANFQVIVTSRPAAFVKAPAFSRKDFLYLVLKDLPRQLINEFAERWIKIRDLPGDQAEDFRTVLKSNLDRAHVADLARNPMQLAILLWLIYVKGWSLPDRRTALYEAYMDTFLNREAEKSAVVRQHRELLLELHGHLGWVLHAQSEVGHGGRAGDMEEAELRAVLKAYLIKEERSPELVDDLFKGVERMFVLVSRIEGRFEFEVQPLREFFAARHLYKTSPHSTSASPAPGSRPDRLEALIRNPYWFNVARFFCGWYDKGELADLTRRLEDLCADSAYSLLGHPRILIARLLRDYVTTASRRDTRALATAMLDELGLRLVLADSNDPRLARDGSPQVPILPPDAGLDTLLDRIQTRLLTVNNDEQIQQFTRVLSNPVLEAVTIEWWSEHLPSAEHQQEYSRWLRIGVLSDAIPYLSLDRALEVFSPSRCSRVDWWRCVEGNRSDVAAFDAQRLEAVIEAVAAGARTRFPEYRTTGSWLHRLTRALWPGRFFDRRQGHRSIVMSRSIPLSLASSNSLDDRDTAAQVGDLRQVGARIAAVVRTSGRELWYCDLEPYNQVCEAIIESFGECWAAWRIALIGATVQGRGGGSSGGLFQRDESIVARALRARLAADDRAFWLDHISAAQNAHDRLAVAAGALAWAQSDLWPELFQAMTPWWNELELHEVGELRVFIPRLIRLRQPGRRRPSPLTARLLADFHETTPASLLSFAFLRMNKAQRDALIERIEAAPDAPRHQPFVSADTLWHLLSTFKSTGDWKSLSPRIATHYGKARFGLSLVRDPFTYHDFQGRVSRFADDILSDPMSYPLLLVRAADGAASAKVVRRVPSLHKIARQDQWFPDE